MLVGNRYFPLACALTASALAAGCGINKSRLATEQIVISDAVDKTVASIDFSPLSGRAVFFDTQYLDGVNMGVHGNIKYVVSSLRQQMLAYDLRLQEKPDTAEYIVEARVGVLANDGYEVTYGIPGSAAVASASALLASPIPAPALPELSLGRRNHQVGTAKIGLFAFDRVTREPVWQAGVRKGASEARDTWLLGLGPYHRRTSAESRGARVATNKDTERASVPDDPLAAFSETVVFERAIRPGSAPAVASAQPATAPSAVAPASYSQPVEPRPIPLPAVGTPAPKPLRGSP
jgi:hypothetical protein